MNPSPGPAAGDLLAAARRAEKAQALFYRSLAARAEEADDAALAQRFHDLHADEQHHLSRLTARILEIGGTPEDLSSVGTPPAELAEWEAEVPRREDEEVARYRAMAGRGDLFDDATLALIGEILEVEVHHRAELGGKWTMA